MHGTVRSAWVAKTALNFMVAEATRALPFETGGILVGYWVKPRIEVAITHAIGPGAVALHRHSGFEPDYLFHEQAVAELYETSGRLQSYVGDWHTHPGSSGNLSRRDRQTLRSIADFEPARAPTPVMAILCNPSAWKLRLQVFFPSRLPGWLLLGKAVRLAPLIYFDSA